MKNNDFLKVSEFARLCGVTRQTVYNRLKELEQEHSNPTDYIVTVDAVKMLTPKGQEWIMEKHGITQEDIKSNRERLENEPVKTDPYQAQRIQNLEYENERLGKSVDAFLAELDLLKTQLETKDKQIETLSKLLDNTNNALNDAVRANREQLHLQYLTTKEDKDHELFEKEEPKQEKKGFFDRLFKR